MYKLNIYFSHFQICIYNLNLLTKIACIKIIAYKNKEFNGQIQKVTEIYIILDSLFKYKNLKIYILIYILDF